VAALDDFADLGDPTDLSDLGESDSGESDSAEAEVEPEPVAPPRPASELGQPREPGLSGMELQDENLRIAGDTEWRPLVRVISEDRSFADEFLAGLDCETEIISFREISWLSHQTPANILVVDMRPDRAMSELAAIISVAAGVEPVVVLPDVSKAGSAYDLGARAVIPDQPSALANYIGSMLLAAPTNVTQGSRALRPESRGFSRLREILSELRGSAPSATRILSLMRVVSDFAERAAVFVLTGNQMRIIGAFGSSATGAPLVDVIRKAGVLPLTGAFKEAVQRRTVLTSSYQESHFPPMLESALGAPANGRFHVVPIVGGEAVILLIYLDNGDALRPVEGLDVIELAGAQIGLMFENELLKRRSGGNDGDRREATTSSGSS
jgi:hypothetical protein